jgi:hypothetical protein
MTDNDFRVDKPGDPRHDQVGHLIATDLRSSWGTVQFPDGEKRTYAANELRAVIRVRC